jgi:hypothetical protein
MKNATFCKIILSFCCFMFINVALVAQDNHDRQYIIDALKRIPALESPDSISGYIANFNSADVPLIYSVVYDRTFSNQLREIAAYAAVFLQPDQEQINRIIQYTTTYLPLNNQTSRETIIGSMLTSIQMLYKNTKDDELLKPFRMLYDNSASDGDCQYSIVRFLSATESVNNRAFYNGILKHSGSSDLQRAYAAVGLGQSGSLEAIPYLRNMADYIFDIDNISNHTTNYWMAIETLDRLASKHYEASKEIQDIITNICVVDPANYGYMLKSSRDVYDLFGVMQRHAQEGNRKYFENLLSAECRHPNVKKWAIITLGSIGDENTIEVIKSYAVLYPVSVANAIADIQKRINN